jgi:Flp pilus assembly protein TadG
VRGRVRPRGDAGAAVVDLVLVSVLLLALFLLVFQVGVVLHARTVLVAAAQDGARYGANADRTPQDGAGRTSEAIATGLSRTVADRMTVTAEEQATPEGLRLVEVTVTGPLPVVFLPAGPLRLTVQGHALEEGR